MHELHIPDDARVEAKPSRPWGLVSFGFAMAAFFAGGALANDFFEVTLTAENYARQGPMNDFVAAALGWTVAISIVLSIVFALMAGLWFTLGGVAVVVVLAAIAVPGFLRACCAATESTVIGTLRGINSSQQAYSSSCSNGKYAPTFETLLKPPLTGGTAFISPSIRTRYVAGFVVTMHTPDAAPMEQASCNGERMGASTYFVEAHFVGEERGHRSFATDERGTVYQRNDGKAIQPGMAGAQPIQ